MKQYLLLISTFLSFSLSAQNFNYLFISHYGDLSKYSTVDSAYLKCSYTLTYLKDSLNLNEKSADLQILLVGKNISKYYSQYMLDYNHFVAEYIKKGQPVPSIKENGAWNYELFKNYPQGKETVTDISSMLQGNFIYEEELPFFDWKITGEKQTILSYKCQKATVSFRGRDYVAWFATDIPIPNGPWKFGGLPGLILKLYDSKEYFVYQCNGLEQLIKKEPVKFYKLDYTKLNCNDMAKLYKQFHDDMAAYLKQMGRVTKEIDTKTQKAKQVEHSSSKIPYNPIELE
jgi:GLPGLI family protein